MISCPKTLPLDLSSPKTDWMEKAAHGTKESTAAEETQAAGKGRRKLPSDLKWLHGAAGGSDREGSSRNGTTTSMQ